MGQIYDQASEVYRDNVTDGVQASGPYEPKKAEIRDLFKTTELAVYAAQASIAIVADIAARDAFFADAGNRAKLVYVNNNNGAADDPDNGVYEYVGGATRIATGFYQAFESVVQPLVDDAQSARDSALDAAAAAQGSADDVADAVASITPSAIIETQGIPARNQGVAGNFAIDAVNKRLYTAKEVDAGWNYSVPVAADPYAPDLVLDFTSPGDFSPYLTLLRATAMTNRLAGDAPGTSYDSFAPGEFARRDGTGLLIYPDSKNWLTNSAAPADQTTVALPIGAYMYTAIGGDPVAITAGTAVASGLNTFAAGTRNVIIVTTTGTLTLTCTGDPPETFQLEDNVNGVNNLNAMATPFIETAGAGVQRNADDYLAAGDLLAAFQEEQGTFYLEFDFLETRNMAARGPTLLGFNSSKRIYAGDVSTLGYDIDGGMVASVPIGLDTWAGRVRFGIAYSGATTTFGAGSHLPMLSTKAWNNGVPVTSVNIGGFQPVSLFGNSNLAGALRRIERYGARHIGPEMFERYSSRPYAGVTIND